MTGFKIDVKNEYGKIMHIIRMAVIYLSLLILFSVYFSNFEISAGVLKLAFVLLFTVPIGYFTVVIKKYRIVRIIGVIVVAIFILLKNNSIVIKGIVPFEDSYLKIKQLSPGAVLIPKTEVNTEFWIILICIQIIFSCIFTAVLMAKHFGIIPVLIMLTPVFALSGTGYLPSVWNALEILIVIVVYMICYHKNSSKATVKAFIVAGVTLFVMIGVTLALTPAVKEYKKANEAGYKKMRQTLRSLEKFDIENIISKRIEAKGNYTKGGIGKGDLSNLISCRPEGTKELEVIVSENDNVSKKLDYIDDSDMLSVVSGGKPTERVYLKAFVGTTYTGQKWEKLSKDAKEKLSRFAENKNKQRLLLNEPFEKIKAADKTIDEMNNYDYIDPEEYIDSNIKKMKIHLLNDADDNGYFPYYANITDIEGVNMDSYIDGNSKKEFIYDFYPQNVIDNVYTYLEDDFYYNTSEQIKESLESNMEIWKKYSKFVSEEYTGYPDNLKELLPYCDEIQNLSDLDYYEWMPDVSVLADKINREFSNTLTYTLNPGKKPDNQDFVKYFLTESKKGFCVHFASAATLVYRILGYPARYVEGYSIPTDAFEMQDDGTYKAVVTDDMAHAWSETFDETFGWQVREHTKFYSSDDTFSIADFNENNYQKSMTNTETTSSQPTTHEMTTKEDATTATETEETKATQPEDAKHNKNVNNDKKSLWIVIVWCVIVLLILACLTVVQCGIRISNKTHRFRRRKENKGILCMYNEIYELCLFCGFKPKGNTETEIIIQMSKQFPQLNEDEWQWIYDCVIRAAFSGKEAARKEQREMFRLLSKLKRQIWETLGLRKKVIFKFVKAM